MDLIKDKKANGKYVGLDSIKQEKGTSEKDIQQIIASKVQVAGGY